MASGNSQQPLLSSKENHDSITTTPALWSKLGLEFDQSAIRRTKHASFPHYLKRRRILMKRKARSVRPWNSIGRKVRILEKLIPSCSGCMGVERLIRETADYIVALQMRVKVMQIMVDALSAGSVHD